MLIIDQLLQVVVEILSFSTLFTASPNPDPDLAAHQSESQIKFAKTGGQTQTGDLIRAQNYDSDNWSGQTASFALGCFWGAEARFDSTLGVIRSRVGFAGGTIPNPTYHRIGDHAETVQVEYDPNLTNFSNLLDVFWDYHDATMKGPRRYQSIIFYHSMEQKRQAESFLWDKRRNKKPGQSGQVNTEIRPIGKFTDADEDDQKHILQRHKSIFSEVKGLQMKKRGQFDINKSFLALRLNGYLAGYGTMENFEKEAPTLGLTPQAQKDTKNIIREVLGLPL